MTSTSDEALYERLLAGDMAAFDELYERYERPLYGFIRRYLADGAQAEEIFQETFLAVLREREKQLVVRNFKAWLYRVARNLCLNHLRGQGRATRAIEAASSAPAPDDNPETALIAADAAASLRRAVARLPEHLAELYAMRVSGLSYEGVAEILGIPVGTVRSRMNAMLRCLREEMST